MLRPLPVPALASAAPAMAVLRASMVTKLYGSTIALWRADFDAKSGELVALEGPNASGKTTLLRILAGLTAPTSGRVSWTGVAGDRGPRVAHVSHESHLYMALTPLENLRLTAHLARRGWSRRASRSTTRRSSMAPSWPSRRSSSGDSCGPAVPRCSR